MERFIVGTGRCGSTLLSRMLAENQSALSIFEFFTGLDMTRRFRPEPVEGTELAALISQDNPILTMVLRRGYQVPEVTYPYGPSARYTREDRLPWVLGSTLPRISDDPDALFDKTMAFASRLPRQRLAEHYRQLFDWWTRRSGRSCWIERSGSSIDYLASLHECFPEARFLHLHRDGREVALSMREHAPYRLAVTLLFQLPGGASFAEIAALDPAGPPTPDDPITRILKSRPPVEYFGRYWTQQLEHGFEAVAKLDAGQYLELAFEELVARPKELLRAIADFFELEARPADWIERAAALIEGVPPTRFDQLPPDEQERLAEACRAGMRLLGRAP